MAYKRALKNTMTPKAREQLSAKIESAEEFRDAVKAGQEAAPGHIGPVGEAGNLSVNASAWDEKIARLKTELRNGTPEKLSGEGRRQAEQEYKQLADDLSGKLLTRREMDLLPKHGYEYSRAVDKSKRQEVGSPETQRKIHRYRQLGAHLDPDNPEACSTEALRRDH